MISEEDLRNFFKNKSNSIHTICRACLNTGDVFISLFEDQNGFIYSDKMIQCAGVPVHSSDGLPNVICKKCSLKLDIADSFRVQCVRSSSVLQTILRNGALSGGLAASGDCDSRTEVLAERIKDEVADTLAGVSGDDHGAESGNSESELKQSGEVKQEYEGLEVCVSKRDKKSNRTSPSRQTDLLHTELSKNRLSFLVDDGKIASTKSCKSVCPHCKKELSNKSILLTHIKNVHGALKESAARFKRFKCDECAYSSHRSQALTYHKRTHSGERPYRCGVCCKCFAQPSSYADHLRLHSDVMHYTCAECGKQFKTKNSFEKHTLVHTSEKKFVCHVCNKGLKTKKTLKIHIKRHYNIKNFSCDVCGKAFVSHSQLINHSTTHRGKDHECGVCKFKTKFKGYLKVHLQRHSEEFAHKCKCCGAAFPGRRELMKHAYTHTKEKSFTCPECGNGFIWAVSLKRHVLKKHGKVFKHASAENLRMVKVVASDPA